MAGFLLHLSPFVEYFASTDLRMKQEKKMHIYTKWINSKLEKTHPPIKNLYEDLKDGRVIFSLLNVLLNKKKNTEKPEKNSSNYENVQDVLTVLKKRGLEIDIIESGENAKWNEREILALIWQIILHFQIETVLPDELLTTLEDKDSSLRTKHLLDEVEERLLKWIQDVLQGMFVVNDLESSWEDGFAFLFLLSAFRPSAVEMSKALKMSSRERLKYSFDVAEQEFGVPSLLDPSDVEKDEVDKERMLIYFSSLYEVLKNHEVKKPLLMPEIYYTIVYSMKRVQEMMDKVTNKSTGQEIQMELLELRKMIHQFNNRYNDIFRFQSFDHEEFCQVMKDFGELSKRWSALNNKEIPGSRRIINSAHLTIGDKVIEIESVSSNAIVLKYKILYYEIITVIEMIESNIRVIKKDKQSQQTAALIGEIIQMMDQVQEIKIKQLEDLISEVNMAENVDSKELDELNKEFEDFESRLTHIKDFLSNTNSSNSRVPTWQTIRKSIIKVVMMYITSSRIAPFSGTYNLRQS
ncbi:spectrin beta chain, erythrocytic-like isoform X2 [Xenia sp. Carnegie-2017]|uniref:spectrin beta chain, erythrocytic-like isoform X2 n=1 Tax=Xenia sp. Carnegie-2017 TaxID=2897299 RepID=UPI001F03E6B3|nr:spectrin beta chain, erythrocytic-like isoform X2 [Xenia sp. Carnegie-2017]